jgi:hypothetical protein
MRIVRCRTFAIVARQPSAMAKGDGGAAHVIGDTARQVVDGLFGKKD